MRYDTNKLPSDDQLAADLHGALALYRIARVNGDWAAEDEITADADRNGLDVSLEEAKRYRQHTSIERQSKIAREVKKAQGVKCKGCDNDMATIYGKIGYGLIHAHHLVPLSKLEVGTIAKLDPHKDFAVLCPNCHAIIHRMDDVSDVEGLRTLIREAASAG